MCIVHSSFLVSIHASISHDIYVFPAVDQICQPDTLLPSREPNTKPSYRHEPMHPIRNALPALPMLDLAYHLHMKPYLLHSRSSNISSILSVGP